MAEKILVIDGHSILNRAFYGVPDLTNREGLHTNAVYGFLNILFKVLDEEKPDYLAVAFDMKAPTFRHRIYAEYKGTRKPMPEELHMQVPLLRECLTAMHVPYYQKEGLEADDILGTIANRCEKQGLEVSLVSGDRDLLQLATEHTKICIPKTKGGKTETYYYHAAEFQAEYGVTPTEFIDMKALMGDTSDNIPGVPSIGEKTAAKIIAEYHSIENAHEHASEIKPPKAAKNLVEFYDQAQLSKVLAAINREAEFDFSLEDTRLDDLATPEAYEFVKRMNFKSMFARFEGAASKKDAVTPFRAVTDFSEALSLIEDLKKLPSIGLSVMADESEIFALTVFDGEQNLFFPQAGFLTSGQLADFTGALLSGCPAVYLFDYKELLGLIAEPDNADTHIRDVSIAAYLIDPLTSSYECEYIADKYLARTLKSKKDLLGKCSPREAFSALSDSSVLTGDYSPENPFCVLCAELAETAGRSGDLLMAKLAEMGMDSLYRELEMPLVPVLARMEAAGISCDRAELEEYGEKLVSGIDELEHRIYEAAGQEFNINSPKQLGEILFEKLSMPYGKKTKTGYSTSADVLDKLAPDYPVVQDILSYRQLTKLKSTYADGLAVYIRDDGRIHTKFQQTVTATGRLSSTEPNLQNIPVRMELGRQIRRIFRPKEGCVFVDADYSQIELRVLAGMSGDKGLIAAYQNAQDIHAMTASQVFHVPLDQVTPDLRRNAKAVNFGIVYGISAFGLSEGLSITRKEAQEYIARYFETYPGVKHFLDHLVYSAKEHEYAVTYYGRRRPMPELKSSNFMQRSFGERVAMNAPIQGTAADIMKRAMLRVDKKLREEGLQSKVILQIHDELLIEAPMDEAARVKDLLETEMKAAADLPVPMEVEAKTGASWFETK